MSEIRALVRLAISQSRTMMLVLIVTMVTGSLVGVILSRSIPHEWASPKTYLSVLLCWSFLPAGMAALVLFEFTGSVSLNLPQSNCGEWILRSPVRSWKIALVPLVLKTLWIAAVWYVFVTLIAMLTSDRLPRVIPMIGFSAVNSWLLVIAWRPVRVAWLRFVAMAVMALALYGSILVYFAQSGDQAVTTWERMAGTVAAVVLAVGYVSALIVSVSSIELARRWPGGIVPESARTSLLNQLLAPELYERRFISSRSALVWFDAARSRDYLLRTLILMVIPMLIVIPLFFPLNGFTFAVTTMLFVVASSFAVMGNLEGDSRGGITIDPFLARLPISSATMIWTRYAVNTTIAAGVLGSVLIVYGGWAAWPVNRERWLAWATTQARWWEWSDPAAVVGLQLSAMILLFVLAVVIQIQAGFAWTAASGRDWVLTLMTMSAVAPVLTVVGLVTRWLIRQSDWETAASSFERGLAYVPPVIVTLLVIKLAATWIVLAWTRARQLATWRQLGLVIGVWCLVAAVMGTTVAIANPFARFSAMLCLATTIVMIPLSRVILLPLAFSWNRHR